MASHKMYRLAILEVNLKLLVTLTAIALSLSGCTVSEGMPTVPSEAPSPTGAAHGHLNAHGAVDLGLGDPIDVRFPGRPDVAVTITLTGISSDVECTQDFSIPAINGEYLGLAFEVTTANDYSTVSGGQSMHLYGNDFFSVAVDGTRTGLFEAAGCVKNEFPQDIPAGATTTGLLILDSTANPQSIIWEPSTFSTKVRNFEWRVAAS